MPVQKERRCLMSGQWLDTTPETRYTRASIVCPTCGRSLLAAHIRPDELKVMLPQHHSDMPKYA